MTPTFPGGVRDRLNRVPRGWTLAERIDGGDGLPVAARCEREDSIAWDGVSFDAQRVEV
jgi:hypothetical protein